MNFSQRRADLEARLTAFHAGARDLDERSDKTLRNMQKIADESNRVANVAHNARQILDDLDREFERQTKLNGLDITFMFVATAIQCARWYILDNSKFRLTAEENANMVKGIVPGDWRKILVTKVPYDSVGGHRFRTLGHDPVMGWIFGPANILTNTATKDDLITSYRVRNGAI